MPIMYEGGGEESAIYREDMKCEQYIAVRGESATYQEDPKCEQYSRSGIQPPSFDEHPFRAAPMSVGVFSARVVPCFFIDSNPG